MESIFEFDDYKEYVNSWIKQQPRKGRGQLLKISEALSIHTTLLSHTLRGERDLTPEQAIQLADYMGLLELENQYFMALVFRDRAGNQLLKNKYLSELKNLKEQSLQISKRTNQKFKLSEKDKALFYSSWVYSGLRQFSSIESFKSIAEVQEAVGVPAAEFHRVLNFLLDNGLCKSEGNRIKIGPANTHLEASSPFIYQHHKNWRIKGLEKHHKLKPEELFYTAPFSISQKDFFVLRELILKLIQDFLKVANATEPEKVSCLNIDFFDL